MFSGVAVLPIEFLRIISITILYAAAIFGWGCALCCRICNSDNGLADFVARRIVIGCLCFYIGFILLAAAGRLHPSGIFVIWACGLLLGCLEFRPVLTRFRQTLRRIADLRLKERVLFGVICLLAVLQMVCGLTPLTFYDSQVYHLLAPVQFLSAGQLAHIPLNVLTNGPMALQLIFGMSWIADATGSSFKLLITLFGCLSLLAAAQIGRRVGTQAAMTAALFAATYPEFWIHQTFGAVDLVVAGLLVFGAIWWADALERHLWTPAVLAGVAFGLVIASRYYGAVMVRWVLIAGMASLNPLVTRRSYGKGSLKERSLQHWWWSWWRHGSFGTT